MPVQRHRRATVSVCSVPMKNMKMMVWPLADGPEHFGNAEWSKRVIRSGMMVSEKKLKFKINTHLCKQSTRLTLHLF